MKHLIFALLAATALSATPALARDGAADARYQDLLAKAKSGTAPVDWQALRYAYADSSSFELEDSSGARTEMYMAERKKDWPTVAAAAERLADHAFVDISGHVFAAKAYTALNRPADAARETKIAEGLMKSIEAGGGRTTAKAFVVITRAEENDLMDARHRYIGMTKTVRAGGHTYEMLETIGPKTDHIVYYVQMDRVQAAEKKAAK